MGSISLYSNTTGDHNAALGYQAGYSNSTGDHNTFCGANANCSAGTYSNATAIGARAIVAASNSMVLGSIAGFNGAATSTNVGIGVTAPARALHVKSTALTSVRIEGLPQYANDAAAGAAGLVTGDLYVTNVGGDLVLKVKI
jgi:hypothetical protein